MAKGIALKDMPEKEALKILREVWGMPIDEAGLILAIAKGRTLGDVKGQSRIQPPPKIVRRGS